MPYRWEVKEGDQWTAMPDNETVEKDYCDPKNTYRYFLQKRKHGIVLQAVSKLKHVKEYAGSAIRD